MFIAHIGIGLAAKRIAPHVPLGILLLAGQWLDLVCGVGMVTGIEIMRVHPGLTRMNPLEFVSYPWSHGLFMSLVWSSAAGLLAARFYRNRRTAMVLAALVFSHWLFDWISHIPDLPLFFDGSPKVGLGLWNSVAGSFAAEFLVYFGGAASYFATTRASSRVGIWAPAGLVVVFVALFLVNHFGPPPPVTISQRILGAMILVHVLLLPWGNWIERHRRYVMPRRYEAGTAAQ